MRDVLIYISGPMTACANHTIEEHLAQGVKVYLALLQAGLPAFSPHVGGLAPSAWSALPWEQWLEYDKRIIERSTHVLMMPDWAQSKGALREHHYADSLGKPIFFLDSLADLPTFVTQFAERIAR